MLNSFELPKNNRLSLNFETDFSSSSKTGLTFYLISLYDISNFIAVRATFFVITVPNSIYVEKLSAKLYSN